MLMKVAVGDEGNEREPDSASEAGRRADYRFSASVSFLPESSQC